MADATADDVLLVDDPLAKVRRLTLNRPAKRNALNDALRGALFDELRRADRDRSVSVIIIRGAGPCFSAGYDLGSVNNDVERAIAHADGWWSRHVVNNWFEMWDMPTPIIGQVHGWCLAGGTELAAACDLVYVADDAQIGYPPVRLMSPPDMQWQTWLMGLRRGMEALLTGDAMSGTDYTGAIGRLQLATRFGLLATAAYDVLLLPTLAQPPAPVGWFTETGDPAEEFERMKRWTPFTALFNMTGQPAVNVPLHWSPDGLPIGVMLVGRPADEAMLIRLSAQLEQARPWRDRHPALW